MATQLEDLTDLTEEIIAEDDLVYLKRKTGASTYADRKATVAALFGAAAMLPPGGRLTLETGVPVSVTDQTARQVVYYTPYLHNLIGLFDGTRWQRHTFAELQLTLSGLTTGKLYDVFVYDASGTLTLELGAAWTDDTTRSAALTTQDGVLVKSGATTRRYLGTIRASSSTTTEDIGGGTTSQIYAKRYVWNQYNREPRGVSFFDSTNSYTPATGVSIVDASWRVDVVIGYGAQTVPVDAIVVGSAFSSVDYVAFGKDSTSTVLANSGRCMPTTSMFILKDRITFTQGFHYVAVLVDKSSGAAPGGDGNAPTTSQTRLDGVHWC